MRSGRLAATRAAAGVALLLALAGPIHAQCAASGAAVGAGSMPQASAVCRVQATARAGWSGASSLSLSEIRESSLTWSDPRSSQPRWSQSRESADRASPPSESERREAEPRESREAASAPRWSDLRGSSSRLSASTPGAAAAGAESARIGAPPSPQLPATLDLGAWSRERLQPGDVVASLPPIYATIVVGGRTVHAWDDVYYEAVTGEDGATVWRVVPPPPGAIVARPPAGAEPLKIGNTVYYVHTGTYYQATAAGYVVEVPPPGAKLGD